MYLHIFPIFPIYIDIYIYIEREKLNNAFTKKHIQQKIYLSIKYTGSFSQGYKFLVIMP